MGTFLLEEEEGDETQEEGCLQDIVDGMQGCFVHSAGHIRERLEEAFEQAAEAQFANLGNTAGTEVTKTVAALQKTYALKIFKHSVVTRPNTTHGRLITHHLINKHGIISSNSRVVHGKPVPRYDGMFEYRVL